MSTTLLASSPLLPGRSPVEIFYRDEGSRNGTMPILLLHGGWGYSLNSFDRQLAQLGKDFRVVAPDRSGYGRSSPFTEADNFATDFHYRAATETLRVMDSLGIEHACFWGHSDGAVISAILGFTEPARVGGLILEAFHLYPMKPRSRQLFETLASEPESLGADLCEKFAQEFGREHWRKVISSHAKAWIRIAAQALGPNDDLFQGRLPEIIAPTLFIHGQADPRTEPGELDAAFRQVPFAELRIIEGGLHSPHSESPVADLVTQIASEFLRKTKARAGARA